MLWTNIYGDHRTEHASRAAALDALIEELCEAFLFDGPGSDAFYVVTLDPDGVAHGLLDEAEAVLDEDGLVHPGAEQTERLTLREVV